MWAVTSVTVMSHFVTCATVMYNVTSHSLSKSKIKKSKIFYNSKLGLDTN